MIFYFIYGSFKCILALIWMGHCAKNNTAKVSCTTVHLRYWSRVFLSSSLDPMTGSTTTLALKGQVVSVSMFVLNKMWSFGRMRSPSSDLHDTASCWKQYFNWPVPSVSSTWRTAEMWHWCESLKVALSAHTSPKHTDIFMEKKCQNPPHVISNRHAGHVLSLKWTLGNSLLNIPPLFVWQEALELPSVLMGKSGTGKDTCLYLSQTSCLGLPTQSILDKHG